MSFTIKFDELKLSPCKREDEILKKCIHKTFNELNLHIGKPTNIKKQDAFSTTIGTQYSNTIKN